MSDQALQCAAPANRAERTRALFLRLAATETPEERRAIREEIVTLNMTVAQSIAHRYHGHGECDEDLEQVAYMGLSRAVNGYDPAFGKDFLTYAVPTIAGELKKHFRDCCWSVRPPRRVQELQSRITACLEILSQRLDRPPGPAEISAELHADLDDVVEALCADGCFNPTSLDVPVGRARTTVLGDLLGGDDPEMSRAEIHLLLAPLVRELPYRDRDIIALRFYHDWTQEQIAQEFHITQMQVSRLLSRALRRLREQIG